MLCRDIMNIIEEAYPGKYAMDWDNVGLLAGRDDKEVRCIYVAVDATDEVIEAAIRYGADMLVTHHPLIFSGMKRINNQDFIGRRVLRLIQSDISYYAMHTNYDVKRMAQLSCDKMGLNESEALEITFVEEKASGNSVEGIGRIAKLETPITLRECCNRVKQAFSLDTVKVFGSLESPVRRIAICPGSGKSVIQVSLERRADVLITGDIGHHEGIDAQAQGMAVIDAGHYGIEHIFIKDMQQYLLQHTQGIEVEGAPVRHPFVVL